MNFIILACDKEMASIKKQTQCRYCAGTRSRNHMQEAHKDLIKKFHQNMNAELYKELAGAEDRKEFKPKWHLSGNRI